MLNPVIDHMAGMIGEFSMADRDRWRSAPNGRDFGPMETKVRDMKNFAFRGWSGNTGPTVPSGGRAAHLNQLARAEGDSTRIPRTPRIAYKGPEGHPANALFFETKPFSDRQGADTFSSMRWRIAEVDADYDPAAQPLRLPLFEWRAAWDSGELAEFNPRAHIPPSAVEPDKTYRVRARFKDNTGRTSRWSAPVEFTTSAPSIQPLRDALRITEIMFHPAGNPDAEFIEIQNISWSRVALGDLRLAGGVRYDFAAAGIDQLEAGQRLVIARNPELIRAESGDGGATVLGPWDGKLSNNGEAIRLETEWSETVLSVDYNGNWHSQADGRGQSLVLRDPASADTVWSTKAGWMPSLFPGGSPGRGDAELAALDSPLWINEVMPGIDGWIELFNPAGQAANISGWFLSDSPARLAKFRLPSGLTIPPAGFLLLEANRLYGQAGAPGRFEIPATGGALFLSQIAGGQLTGLGATARFGPFEGAASWGIKLDAENRVMASLPISTPGQPNASPGAIIHPLLVAVRDLGQLELRFHAQPDRAYAVESCDRLGPGEWSTVRTVAPSPNGGEVVVRQLIEQAQPERYFRLRVLP